MLRITFTPPGGGQPKEWEFANFDDSLSASEAELIEESGENQWDSFMGWALRMAEGSMRASRVMLWILMRRDDPELKLDEFDFPVSALAVDETDEPEQEPGKDEPADSNIGTP